MSYEDYERVATHYDLTRQPIGLPILIGCFATAGRALAELSVLDAGCGTGSYAVEVLKWVQQVDGIDASLNMIAEAEEKAKARELSADRLRLHHAAINQDLPFQDESFDAVMVNQVLHHLGDEASTGFSQHELAFSEISRVVQPGGVVVINTCSHKQLNDAWWYQPFFPHAFARFQERLIPLEELISMLDERGLAHTGSYVPVGSLVRGDAYFDFEGPLLQEWRDGDSVFSLATAEELADGCAKIREMRDEQTLHDYVVSQDSRRPSIGQVTFLSFTKTE